MKTEEQIQERKAKLMLQREELLTEKGELERVHFAETGMYLNLIKFDVVLARMEGELDALRWLHD